MNAVSLSPERSEDDFEQSMRSHVIISSPEHSGWIWRKRTSWTTSFSSPANRWRRCWFELKGSSLTYWNQLNKNNSSNSRNNLSSSALSALSSPSPSPSPSSPQIPSSPSGEPAVSSISLATAHGPIDYADGIRPTSPYIHNVCVCIYMYVCVFVCV